LDRDDTECLISIVSGWEVVMKTVLGLSAAQVEGAIAAMGATLLPVRFQHLEELSRLPSYPNHRDPFDRMLIAQALSEDLPIVSSDTRFSEYKSLRVLWD
jgi:PIN domain nuclease of toxin-antitoxin system